MSGAVRYVLHDKPDEDGTPNTVELASWDEAIAEATERAKSDPHGMVSLLEYPVDGPFREIFVYADGRVLE